MMNNYKVVFKSEGVYSAVVEKLMQDEFMKVYNRYADMCNLGVTEHLNKEFNKQCPNYDYDKDINNPKLYDRFMADGYTRLVCSILNKRGYSWLLDFYVDPQEVQLKGRLKSDPNATIEFYLKEA